MIKEEYESFGGLLAVDYVKGHIPEETTNKIWCHAHYELMLILSGSITYNDNKGVSLVDDKSAVFIRAHEVHNPFVHSEKLYERYRIRFHKSFFSEVLRDGLGLDKELELSYKKGLSDSDFAEILVSVKNLFDMIKGGENPDKLRAATHLISAVTKSYDAAPRENMIEKNYISDVVEYIKENYSAHLTAENLAEHFFVSRGKLIYDFKAYCNMTLLEYITLTRLEAAKEMLLCGYSVASAADLCGFSSSSYFIKVFSGIVGMTPLKFQINFLRNA